MVDFLPVIQVMFIKYKIILIAKDKIHFSIIMYFPLYVIYQHSQHLGKKKGKPKSSRKKILMLYFTNDLSSQI